MLRRISSMGAVDAAFRMYREHFSTLLLLSLVFGVPTTVAPLLWRVMSHFDTLAAPAVASGRDGVVLPPALLAAALMLLGVWLAIAGAAVSMGATAHIATLAALGRRPTLRDTLAKVWQHLGPISAASLLAAAAAVTGLVALVIPGVVLLVALAFVGPIVLVEGSSAPRALVRSWQLTRGRRLKVFGTLLLCILVGTVVASSAGALTTVVGFVAGAGAAVVVGAVALPLAIGAAAPVWYLAAVLLYYDARAEEEAFDIKMLAHAVKNETEQKA